MQTKWKCLTRENAINFVWWWYIFNFLSWGWKGQSFTKTKGNKDISTRVSIDNVNLYLSATNTIFQHIYVHWLPRYPEGLKRFENLVSKFWSLGHICLQKAIHASFRRAHTWRLNWARQRVKTRRMGRDAPLVRWVCEISKHFK